MGRMKMDMVAAGAYSVALERGMAEKDADAMVSAILEKVASGEVYDDDDDDDSTWWSRNKKWALPTAIATIAALGGIDVGRNWDPNGNVLTNPLKLWVRRLGAILGMRRDQYQKSLMNTPKPWPVPAPQASAETKSLDGWDHMDTGSHSNMGPVAAPAQQPEYKWEDGMGGGHGGFTGEW